MRMRLQLFFAGHSGLLDLLFYVVFVVVILEIRDVGDVGVEAVGGIAEFAFLFACTDVWLAILTHVEAALAFV